MGVRRLLPSLVLVSAGLLAAVCAAALPEKLSITGFAAGRAVSVESQPSWLDGGFGRLGVGADIDDDETTLGLGQLHLALDWELSRFFGTYAHGRLREAPGAGEEAGLVEAYIYGSVPFGASNMLRLRLGHFFLPTSQENVEVAWSSPYTLTYSTINSWIAEEVRLTGLLAETTLAVGDIDELRLGVSPFGGNDTSGTLLAWRGWGLGDRLAVYDEVLPLPPFGFLEPERNFAPQLDDGTRPFGEDLDGRVGWAGFLRWQRPQKARVQWTHYDNRGDRDLYDVDPTRGGGEYAWETDFDLLGFQVHPSSTFSLLGERMEGSTGMGFGPEPYVQLDFESAYFLASYRPGDVRISLRWETFETVDRDRKERYDNNEDGEAWTLAVFWEPGPALRLGVELLDVDAERGPLRVSPEAPFPDGFDFTPDARAVTLELRYYLDF